MIFNNCDYNKELQPLASTLRKNMTKAEASLWKYILRGKNLKGYQFRRQRPVLNYIADFFCKELMLIIEVDGITHDLEATLQKDKQKQSILEEAGFKVIRFTDDEVLTNISGVTSRLESVIEEIEKSAPLPPEMVSQKNLMSSAGGGVKK